jgi:glycosyltransferase involved in cell wall biosynthesis
VSEVERFLGVAAERQTVTYLGVERDVFAPDGGANALPDGRPYVLFVGTQEPFKNLVTLTAAHARAFPRAEVALVIAGSGPPSDERVHALGVVEPAVLARWYRGASAVAVPSTYECFGLPLLEAMSCGTPVIVSRTPSLMEVGGDECTYIDDPLDVSAWADALARAAEDRAWRAQACAAGLARAATFSWDRCAEETFAVLRRTAGE